MLGGVLWCLVAVAAAEKVPNFIFVMADDVGWGDHSYNCMNSTCGDAHPTFCCPSTPNLDAMAKGANSVLFHRFYTGSPVCSPTRAAVMTGRSPQRACIDGAEGCGQKPSWECHAKMPLPWNQFTLPQAVKESSHGYSTMFAGKWHLGDFFHMKNESYPDKKWPYSHPGVFGFDQWWATKASASSSMLNCGCFPPPYHCVTGGGVYSKKPLDCTNYWYHDPQHSIYPTGATNVTEKEPGDDNTWIMDKFETYLKSVKEAPFLAVLWLHTVHVPHPAMPEWYNKAPYPKQNGDYQGTIMQMDAQIGRLRQMLKDEGVADNTALFYTADNGPHGRNWNNGASTSGIGPDGKWFNGLRQCKASTFEGGIHVPGILEWPNVVKSHQETWLPFGVYDYLPTVMELLNVTSKNPTWPLDGASMLPFLHGQETSRSKPYGIQAGKSRAWIHHDMKIVKNPLSGQCSWVDKKYSGKTGYFLFNLTADPTESHDLKETLPTIFKQMQADLTTWDASVENSRVKESQCVPPTGPDTESGYLGVVDAKGTGILRYREDEILDNGGHDAGMLHV